MVQLEDDLGEVASLGEADVAIVPKPVVIQSGRVEQRVIPAVLVVAIDGLRLLEPSVHGVRCGQAG